MTFSTDTLKRLRKNQIAEIICVIALFVFIIILIASRSGGTDKDVRDVASPIIKAMQKDEMSEKTNADAIKAFGFDIEKADGIVYYANENIMDVSEMLIVKLKDKADAQEFKSAIETRVENQKTLYKSYAPDQYSLLEKCTVEISGNTVFYCTSLNASKYCSIFKKSL